MISRTISASENVVLGSAHESKASAWMVSITSLSGTHSIVPKGRIYGSSIAEAERQDIAYIDAATGTTTDPGATPITAEGIYKIPADGLEVFLHITVTSNSFVLTYRPVID